MALDPLCICFFGICFITCWRCFLPFTLALPIMPYPLYIVTLKSKIKNEIEDNTAEGRNDFKNSGKPQDSKKTFSDVKGSITEITPVLNTRICYSDYEEFSRGDCNCKRQCNYYGSLSTVGNIFPNPEFGELIEVKTENKDTKIQTFGKADIKRHNAKSAIEYCLSKEIENKNDVSTNTCSSSTESLINSRKGKKCAFWMRNKTGLYELVSRSKNFLKKYTHRLKQKNTTNRTTRK